MKNQLIISIAEKLIKKAELLVDNEDKKDINEYRAALDLLKEANSLINGLNKENQSEE